MATAGGENDWIAETRESINARLDGAKASQTQTRLTLGGMAIISAMMLIASYNAYFSYDYRYLTDRKVFDRRLGTTTVSDTLLSQAAKDWAVSRTIQISLLGIRVSVDDAAVLGTCVLALLSFWLVLVTRRENHTIGLLLSDTDSSREGTGASADTDPSIDDRWLIFHTITANALFITPDRSLASIDSLGGHDPYGVKSTGFRGWANETGFTFLRNFFFLFPVVTSVIVFGIDRYSYFAKDPFDARMAVPGIDDPFFFWSQAAYCIALIPLALCCRKASVFSRATESVLRQYCDKLMDEVRRRRLAAGAPPPRTRISSGAFPRASS